MLKTGKVYIYNDLYVLVFGHRRFKGRRIYTVQRVTPNGSISMRDTFEVQYKKGDFQVTDVKVTITTTLRKTDVETLKYYKQIKQCRELLISYATEKRNNADKFEIAQNIIGMLGMYDAKTKRQATLQDIAKKLGFKRNAKMYAMITSYYKYITSGGRKNAISEAKDGTIIKSYEGYQDIWVFVHGFSNSLDKLLEKDLNFYIAELRLRNL